MATPGPVPIEASFIGRERQAIVRWFLAQHALDAEDAIAYRPATPAATKAFARMLADGIIRAPAKDRFYLNHAAWRADAEERRRRGFPIVAGVTLLIVVALVMLYRG